MISRQDRGPHLHCADLGQSSIEGVLETRGPGVVGRWKPQWFRLEGHILDVFTIEHDGPASLEGRILLNNVANLTLEESKGEFSFHANGTKVRVRSANVQGTKHWFSALQASLKNVLEREADAFTTSSDFANCNNKLLSKSIADGEGQRDLGIRRHREEGGHGGSMSSSSKSRDVVGGSARKATEMSTAIGSGQSDSARQGAKTPNMRKSSTSPSPPNLQRLGVSDRDIQPSAEQLCHKHDHSPPMDVWVQVDTVTGLPRQVAECGKYRVRARWQSLEFGQDMEERNGIADGVGGESCVVRQQVLLAGVPGQRALVISVERRGRVEEEHGGCVWSCVVSAADPAHLTAQWHSMVDGGGQQTSVFVRLKLKPARPIVTAPEASQVRSSSVVASARSVIATTAHANEVRRPAPGDSPPPPRRRVVASRSSPGLEGECSNGQAQCHEYVGSRGLPDGSEDSGCDLPGGAQGRGTIDILALQAAQPPAGVSLANTATIPSRIAELHALHDKRRKERQERQEQAWREEEERIVKEAHALKRAGSRNQIKREDLQPAAASERLYSEHKDLELRMRLRQEKKEAEERERLEASRIAARPARAVSPASIGPDGREVGHRLHAMGAELAQRRLKQKEEHVAMELNKYKKVGSDRVNHNPEKLHDDLHEEGKKRLERRKKMQQDREEKERKELDEKAVSGNRPVNAARIRALFMDHADRLRRANLTVAEAGQRELSKALQVCGCGCTFQSEDVRCRRCGAKRPETTHTAADIPGSAAMRLKAHKKIDGELFKRNVETKERKERVVAELKKQAEEKVFLICGCGNPFEANFADRCKKCGAKRPEASTLASKDRTLDDRVQELRAPADTAAQHAAVIVNACVALRCGCTKDQAPTVGLRPLLEPLKAAIGAYRTAAQGSETAGEGFSYLRTRPSQRLFLDGWLLDDGEAWHQQCEPDPIRQLDEDFEALMTNAEAAHTLLMQMVGSKHDEPCVEDIEERWRVGEKIMHPRAAKTALFAYNPGIKSRDAAQMKAFVRYGPAEGSRRFRHLLDLSRLSLIFSDCANLRAGLDQLLEEFEVVDIRNHYLPGMLGLLGERYIEVLVVVKEGLPVPHVCELRLEELAFFQAREEAAPHLRRVCKGFATIYESSGAHPGAIEYLARKVLRSPGDSHGIRVFRRHLGRCYGSPIVAWRKVFGASPLVPFAKFKEACQQLSTTSYQARAVEYWQGLDAGRGGIISLFELDPDGVVLLAKVRERILALIPGDDAVDVERLFTMLCSSIVPSTPGSLEASEFRSVVKAMGLNSAEADRVFSYLDAQGGGSHLSRGPAYITAKDLTWLLRLPNLVHIDSVMLVSAESAEELARCRARWAGVAAMTRPRPQRPRVLGRQGSASRAAGRGGAQDPEALESNSSLAFHANGQQVLFQPTDRSLPQVVVTPADVCDEIPSQVGTGLHGTREILADMDARLEGGSIATNAELAVTLVWDTCDDLDILVALPGGLGEISRHCCQVLGVSVLAANLGEENSSGGAARPVLHVQWSSDASDGDSRLPPYGQYLVRGRLLQKLTPEPAHWTCRVLLRGSLHAVTQGVWKTGDAKDVELVRFACNGNLQEFDSDASDVWAEDIGITRGYSPRGSAESAGSSAASSESDEVDCNSCEDEAFDHQDHDRHIEEDECSDVASEKDGRNADNDDDDDEEDDDEAGDDDDLDAAIQGTPVPGPESMLEGSDLEETF
eukprot:CAMPEP_0115394162 /NCGR_PEP_ID=MMETSP0271-20121206/12124_1 /TAXON_ID=71861 /ORGANISM="Scrippsiella trochoidea, Strain CCMP3099" /LENGTH=1717 /DNA_ID=CAMNT_0002817825 /DNA_START=1 /DNA_END=5155 /DNA_ORIENTATION=-